MLDVCGTYIRSGLIAGAKSLGKGSEISWLTVRWQTGLRTFFSHDISEEEDIRSPQQVPIFEEGVSS